MGIFNNWILSRAAKITAQNEANREAEYERQRTDRERTANLKKQIFSQLTEFIDSKAEEFKKTPCDLNEGDDAILNIYSLTKSGYNGWDGGPHSLLGNIPNSELTEPVVVKITSIGVDKSLALNLLDIFYEYHDFHFLEKAVESGSIVEVYTKWLNKTRGNTTTIGEVSGLYWNVHFENRTSFKPKWGLNSNSFLLKGTPEFDETHSVWSEEIAIEQERKRVAEDLDKLKNRKTQIQEKYHNIKYVC